MGPAEVTVVTLQAEKVTLQTELAGRTTASLSSEVRPQISGIVKARTFEEGARVKAGQVLYQIEPAHVPRGVRRRRRRTSRARRRTLEAAKLKDDRYAEPARRSRACRSRRPTTRALAHEQAIASVAQKQAALETARINLGYTSITRADQRAHRQVARDRRRARHREPAAAARDDPRRSIRSTSISPSRARQRLRLRAQLGAGALQAGSDAGQARCCPTARRTRTTARSSSPRSPSTRRPARSRCARSSRTPTTSLLPGMYVRAVLDEAVDQDRDPRAAAGHHARREGQRDRDGRRRRRQGRAAHARRRPRDRRSLAGRRAGLKDGDKLIVEGLNKIGPGHAGARRTSVGLRRRASAARARRRPQARDMLARFFASRPVFAWVISIVIMLAGRRVDPRAAGRAVPRRRAAERQHLRRLLRRVGRRPSRTASRRCSSSS